MSQVVLPASYRRVGDLSSSRLLSFHSSTHPKELLQHHQHHQYYLLPTMDAYSFYTMANRKKSRIYQDLNKSRGGLQSPVDRTINQLRNLSIMGRVLQQETPAVDPARKPHIGVVGAGLAGLRSADILLSHGFQVTILEARNRLGGRVHQETIGDRHSIDMGPNWIHGTKSNPILELARETNTELDGEQSTSFIFDEDGELLPTEDGSKRMWDILTEAFDFSNRSGSEIDPSKTLRDYFEEHVKDKIPDTEDGHEKKRQIVLQSADTWGSFVGSPIEKQSLKFLWLEECIGGENLFCAGTYKRILDRIASPALNGATIRYNTKVSEIRGKSTTVHGRTVAVKTVDGHQLEFDELIVTTPLGWLKRNLDAFSPPLPDRLTNAIKSIGYGCLEKVYISFPRAFWLDSDENGPEAPRTLGFHEWLSPKYATDSNPNRWIQDAVDLASLTNHVAHPTLLLYIYGEQSKHITSGVRSLKSRKEKVEFLNSYFKPYYSRLPKYNEDDGTCHPIDCISTDWLGDDLAGNGSYCNFPVGLEEGDEDLLTMRAGVPDEGIWLAGEHTAPFVAVGTTTGAYWSGEDVAMRVVETCSKRS
ncbi:hypothetical protein V8F20_002040 [Naviculisporaceae sp. PSN 640]